MGFVNVTRSLMTIFFHGKRHQAVIAYDVSANSTRRRVFRILKDWKIDGQKSLVECRLRKPRPKSCSCNSAKKMDLKQIDWPGLAGCREHPAGQGNRILAANRLFHWLRALRADGEHNGITSYG